MSGRDHSCDGCGRGGFNDPDGECECVELIGVSDGEKARLVKVLDLWTSPAIPEETRALFAKLKAATNQTQAEANAEAPKSEVPVGDSDLIGRCAEAILFRGEPGVWDDAEPSDRNESLLDARFAVAAVVPLVRADTLAQVEHARHLLIELMRDAERGSGLIPANVLEPRLSEIFAALACIGTEGE